MVVQNILGVNKVHYGLCDYISILEELSCGLPIRQGACTSKGHLI